MSQVFISYSSNDVDYACRLKAALNINGISSWYAPLDILDGENFAEKITEALADDECNIFVALLSQNYMNSKYCHKEWCMATKSNKIIYVLKIDNAKLDNTYSYELSDIQITEAYHLNNSALSEICCNIMADVKKPNNARIKNTSDEFISCNEINIKRIASGDPYYSDGITLHTNLTDYCFFLAPPSGLSTEEKQFAHSHCFSEKDCILDTSIQEIAQICNIPNLTEEIELSRKIIFEDFYKNQNGCYFNNKKYGIQRISPYGRTEDMSELPELTIDFYTTDYFTHRVMKDVCKRLFSKNRDFINSINFSQVYNYRIFLTSLGVNVLLTDSNCGVTENVLLTRRSKNSAETFGKTWYSMSVIEGVSLSDYDTFDRKVHLNTAVLRGLNEELGVKAELVRRDSIKFYDLFVNLKNLEIGISCSIELLPIYKIETEILKLCGKDDELEIDQKIVCNIDKLRDFILKNKDEFLTQAIYAIGSYLNAMGKPMLIYKNNIIV